MSKLSPKIQQESSCIFPQGKRFMIAKLRDLGTREVVTCVTGLSRSVLQMLCFTCHTTTHFVVPWFCCLLSKIPGPFDPRTPVVWEKVVKTLNIWGSRIQVCVFQQAVI